MAEHLLRELQGELPHACLLQDPAQLALYGGDESGMEPVSPLAVVQARCVADIQETLRLRSAVA